MFYRTNVANTQSQVQGPKNNNKSSNLPDSKGHLRNNSIHPSPRQSETFLHFLQIRFWTKSCGKLWSKVDLKLQFVLKVLESFFSYKTPSFPFKRIIFLYMVCALKEELPPFSNNSIYAFFFDLIRKTYFVANTHLW